MPIFLVFGTHHSENCPMFNEKARKVFREYVSKRDGLLKKHGVKMIGSWTVIGEHLAVWVFEAASSDAFGKFLMEPELMAVNTFETMEVKMALSSDEVMKCCQKLNKWLKIPKPKTTFFS
jgi:uncharacterized protein with GYD domain